MLELQIDFLELSTVPHTTIYQLYQDIHTHLEVYARSVTVRLMPTFSHQSSIAR